MPFVNMYSLPNELLAHIASHFDTLPPSIEKFSHEPTAHLTESDTRSLKTLSLVSWRWRKVAVPILFRYARIPLDEEPQWVPVDARLIEDMQGQLTRLSDHEMQIYQKMRTKFKSSSMFAFDETFDELLTNLCRVQDGDGFLKSVPHIHWIPHLPKTFSEFARFVSQYDLKHRIKSIVVFTSVEYELRQVVNANAPLSRAVSEIWSSIFMHVDPWRVVVAAPPATLAGLLDTEMLSSDTWAFEMKMHYIELRQPETRHIEHLSSGCRPWDAALIHRRPWSHLGYNEGSTITAYSTYEYHLKQSPRILYLTLSHLARDVQDCCNIRTFSFTGIFPFSTNVTTVVRALHRVRTLQRVQFQLAPGEESDLLSPERMGRAQPEDLWLEWNESYKAITSLLGVYEFEDGSEFVSEDCETELLAYEVADYVETRVKRGTGWRRVDARTWVRDRSQDGQSLAVAEAEADPFAMGN